MPNRLLALVAALWLGGMVMALWAGTGPYIPLAGVVASALWLVDLVIVFAWRRWGRVLVDDDES